MSKERSLSNSPSLNCASILFPLSDSTGLTDNSYRADTFQDGQARGALSWAFIKSLQQWPQQSYLQLLNTIRAELDGKYSQKPQLSCSHPLGKLICSATE